MTSMIADKTRAGLMGPNHVKRLSRVESIVRDPTAFTDIQPTLDLDFRSISGAPFVGNLTRATVGGYRMNAKGVLVPTVVNEPVIDFDANGKPVGTGFYGAYTNLLLRSEELDNASWLKSNVTVTANSIAAPDGNATADTLTTTVAGGYIYQPVTLSPTGDTNPRTFSVFLKQGTAAVTEITLDFLTGGTQNNAKATLTWSTLAVVLSGTANSKSYLLEDVGGGWYRLSLTASNSGGANTTAHPLIVPTTTGTGTVYAWGAQLTATAFPVPYVPTTSATVARNADSMVISGTDFTDFFNPVEGTFYAEGDVVGEPSSVQNIVDFNDGTSNNVVVVRQGAAISGIDLVVISGGASQVDTGSANVRQGGSFKLAARIKKDDFQLIVNGASIASDTSGNMPAAFTRMVLTGLSGAGFRLKRLIYWPKALTATELQRMTA